MKASRLSALLFVASLLLPAAILAGNTNKKTLHLFDSVTVEGKTLSPGDYRIEWNDAGPNVQLDIVRGRDTVATVPAKVVTASNKNQQDGYTLKPGQNGGQQLLSIFFSGKDYSLEIQEPGSAAAASGGTN
jgi:hypothetical protein